MLGRSKAKKNESAPGSRVARRPDIGQVRRDFGYFSSGRTTPTRTNINENRAYGRRSDASGDNIAGIKRKGGFRKATGLVLALLLIWTMILDGSSRVEIVQKGTTASTVLETAMYQQTTNKLLRENVLNFTKLTVDANGISTKLRKQYPEIDNATLTVPLVGSHATMHIDLSKAAFVLRQNSTLYILSESGYITGASPSGSDLPMVVDETGEEINVNKRLLASSHVSFMQKVYFQLDKGGLTVQSLLLPAKKPYEIDAVLKGKQYIIKFNLEEDPIQQSGAALAVIESLGNTMPKEYIDVRVPGRAYYK